MSGTKISVIIDQGVPAREKKDPCCVLKERVDYAVDCLEADYNKEQAIEFLRKVKDKLDSIQTPKDKHIALLDTVKAALSDYGYYHLGGQDKETLEDA